MNIDTQRQTDKEDNPLTKADVKRFLHEVGSPDKLNLSRMNLMGVDLSGFNLSNANLSNANLSNANLSGANLSGVNLSEAKLERANLSEANLLTAQLRQAKLRGAFLLAANLFGADLSGADLSRADLLAAKLQEANLLGANLRGANLRGADLSGAILLKDQLRQAKLHGAELRAAIGLEEMSMETAESTPAFRIRINEDPLPAQSLTTIMSALTGLFTKFWLIQQGRFPDLVEYALTRDARFTKEANVVITDITHNSLFDFKFDVSLNPETAAKAAEILYNMKKLEAERKEEAKLKNQAVEEEIEH